MKEYKIIIITIMKKSINCQNNNYMKQFPHTLPSTSPQLPPPYISYNTQYPPCTTANTNNPTYPPNQPQLSTNNQLSPNRTTNNNYIYNHNRNQSILLLINQNHCNKSTTNQSSNIKKIKKFGEENISLLKRN